MFRDVKNWLNKPYYFNPSIKFKFKISLIVGFIISFFLFVFEPFLLTNFKDFLFTYSLYVGLICILSLLFCFIISPKIFKDFFDEDQWTVGKNLFFLFLTVFFTGCVLCVYTYYYKLSRGISQITFLRFMYYTYLVATFPILFYVFYNEYTIRKKREKEVKKFNQTKKEKLPKKNITIKITSDNSKEYFEFLLKDLVYITSEGNYASFFTLENNTLKESILRVTLGKIEESLADVNYLIRCHKSYIVNTKYVKNIRGNARGYLLIIDLIDFDIPVSRKFSKASLSRLLN